jgi:hypothetical protein
MHIFIVMLHHTMDDLPVAAYAGQGGNDSRVAEQLAFALAERIDEMPTEQVREVYNVDVTTPVCTSVVEMVDGMPFKKTVVREFASC